MHFAGIDIGSRTIELVVVDEHGQLQKSLQTDTTFNPIEAAKALLEKVDYDSITATGYGRNLFEIAFDTATVTEIKAHALAAYTQFPDIRAILDIGGQDSKVISLMENGKVQKFEMNDRCAAGTGKFLEIMARTLGYEIDDFGSRALQAEKELHISSMCTVFAESEVTSLIAKGEKRQEIARGLHESVVRRAAAMINRVTGAADIVFTGGVAKNPCIVGLLADKLQRDIHVPDDPQAMGAFGAALLSMQTHIDQ